MTEINWPSVFLAFFGASSLLTAFALLKRIRAERKGAEQAKADLLTTDTRAESLEKQGLQRTAEVCRGCGGLGSALDRANNICAGCGGKGYRERVICKKTGPAELWGYLAEADELRVEIYESGPLFIEPDRRLLAWQRYQDGEVEEPPLTMAQDFDFDGHDWLTTTTGGQALRLVTDSDGNAHPSDFEGERKARQEAEARFKAQQDDLLGILGQLEDEGFTLEANGQGGTRLVRMEGAERKGCACGAVWTWERLNHTASGLAMTIVPEPKSEEERAAEDARIKEATRENLEPGGLWDQLQEAFESTDDGLDPDPVAT